MLYQINTEKHISSNLQTKNKDKKDVDKIIMPHLMRNQSLQFCLFSITIQT